MQTPSCSYTTYNKEEIEDIKILFPAILAF